jgi:hypothetical protein
MDDTQTFESDRTQREMRALAAVNRQLHAQLEGGMVRVARGAGAQPGDLLGVDGGDFGRAVARRVAPSTWFEQLDVQGGSDARLVRADKRGVFVLEGTLRRQLKAGMVTIALARVLGEPRDVPATELDRFQEGPPVEVMEGDSGPAFVLVGGRRWPIRGLPLPHRISNEEMQRFPEAQELNLAAVTGTTRTRVKRARAVLGREGTIRGAAMLASKGARKLSRKLGARA